MDATPEVEAKYAAEIDRVQKQFGAVSGEDFTKFPVFNFQGNETFSSFIVHKERW